MKDLSNKVIIITGVTSGIGLDCLERLVDGGAFVIGAGRREEIGGRIEKKFKDKVKFFRCDVTKESQIIDLVKYSETEFGKLDVMVNNAGAPDFINSINDLTSENVNRSIQLLFNSVVIGTREACKVMEKKGQGSVINIGSIAAHRTGYAGIIYSSMKAAVVQFSKVAAIEVAQHGIRINSISPGLIVTEIWSDLGPEQPTFNNQFEASEDGIKDVFKLIQPTGRAGLPRDISNVVAFLASDDSTFITAQDLVVDGGIISGRTRDQKIEEFGKVSEVVKSKNKKT